jgi:DNA-binding protein HU-beta
MDESLIDIMAALIKRKLMMNKKELIAVIAEKSNLTHSQAEAAFAATFDTIQAVMIEQGNIAVPGFGSFATKIREERKGRNPATGKEIVIPKAIVPVFKAGTQLKASVNKCEEE